jgi:hypothetical protein
MQSQHQSFIAIYRSISLVLAKDDDRGFSDYAPGNQSYRTRRTELQYAVCMHVTGARPAGNQHAVGGGPDG